MTTSAASVCADGNSFYCGFYASNNFCFNYYYINGMPLPDYCPLSCKRCSSTGTTTPKPCVDTQYR